MNFDEIVPCTEWTPLELKLFRGYEEMRDKWAAERERCAKIAEELHVFKDEYSVCATIAARIRGAQ